MIFRGVPVKKNHPVYLIQRDSELCSCSELFLNEILKPFIFRLEQELVQKEAADAAMAREKEVLKLIQFKSSLPNLIQM